MTTTPNETESQDNTPVRVLLVDDEPALLKAYERMLRATGAEVYAASTGTEALQTLKQTSYDVVVSDIHMDDMNGITLLKSIRRQAADLPVILITGLPTVESAVEAVEYGALRYLRKPVSRDDLVKAIMHGEKLHRIARLKREVAQHLGEGEKPPGDRAGLEASFERALQSLWIAYQPIINWSEQKIEAYEAFVRTKEPSIPHPGALLSAAERLGRLFDLGQAIRAHIGTTISELAPECDIYVNLHPADLMDDTLYDPNSPLRIHSHKIVLEITERDSLDGVDVIPERVARLRELGFRIAVDDLGAGFAGLSYFARIEPEVVKLDMSLIRDIDQTVTKQRLVFSLTQVAKELGMTVIAEGIETAGERDQVNRLGCDLLQGYLFAKPAPPFPKPRWS